MQDIPSCTERLPNIMLEAMAFGTSVCLADLVEVISDVIINEKTGFIMENNSPDLERIVGEGRRFVREDFMFERVVERWKEVLERIRYGVKRFVSPA